MTVAVGAADVFSAFGGRSLASGERALAHDIRRPLAALSLCAELLLEGRDSDAAVTVQLMDTLRRNAKLLMELVSDPPPVSHGPEQRVADLAIVATEVSEVSRAWVARRGQRLWLDRPDLSLVVAPSRAELFRAIINLVDNASKFGADGDVITLRVGRAGDNARLSVHDHGRSAPNGHDHGHGIGLAVVRWVVERAGGKSGLERNGDETVSWFTLPLLAAQEQGR